MRAGRVRRGAQLGSGRNQPLFYLGVLGHPSRPPMTPAPRPHPYYSPPPHPPTPTVIHTHPPTLRTASCWTCTAGPRRCS